MFIWEKNEKYLTEVFEENQFYVRIFLPKQKNQNFKDCIMNIWQGPKCASALPTNIL